MPEEVIVHMVFNLLVAGVICLKHEGFREEREWRAIYAPNRTPSDLMTSSIEVINGIPQQIYQIPLDVTVSPALQDLDFAKVFDRLIIGPTSYPLPIYDAFVKTLRASGVTDAETKVFISGIPIRS